MNIEECLGIDPGELLQNGVREALVAIAAGQNVDNEFFDSHEAVEAAMVVELAPDLKTDTRILSRTMPDDCGVPRGITQPHARAATGSSQ